MHIQVQRQQGTFRIDVSIRASKDGITALYGPSGAGKTSVINMVAGLQTPDSGKIVINEHCLFDSEKKINLPPEKRHLGYVFQEARLFPHMSIQSNLLYGRKRGTKDQSTMSVDHVIDILGIQHLLHRKPKNLSGGEKQRVALGRALLSNPQLLLMDEPFASLDHAKKMELLPFIQQINRTFHVPILYVSHSQEELMSIADTIIIMHDGQQINTLSHNKKQSSAL